MVWTPLDDSSLSPKREISGFSKPTLIVVAVTVYMKNTGMRQRVASSFKLNSKLLVCLSFSSNQASRNRYSYGLHIFLVL